MGINRDEFTIVSAPYEVELQPLFHVCFYLEFSIAVFLLGASKSHQKQFTRFTLNARAASNSNRRLARLSFANPKRVGRFQLFDDALTEFSSECVNTVAETDDVEKNEIQIMWVAPAAGSGCVALSAMVFENGDSWFADDGQLTKIICEGAPERENADDQCCACDEAKYNVRLSYFHCFQSSSHFNNHLMLMIFHFFFQFVFEGIWSNETHPRDYPFAIWLTHFSDVIGASHDANFSFWGENHIATDGFRSLAEWGSVRALEFELRAKGPRLRTLIKAAGLWYPNVNTNTTANFRVDRKHHELSLTSMFGPSPDWVVGVSGLNLCQADCTWMDSIDIDLYPWDAGTDNGITYMSPNSETFPRERMYRITTMFPEDPRQPFYNPKSREMTPLARLYIRKTKTIPRNCDDSFLQSQVLDISENTEEGADRRTHHYNCK